MSLRDQILNNMSHDDLLDACIKAEHSEANRAVEVARLKEENIALKKAIELAVIDLNKIIGRAPLNEAALCHSVMAELKKSLK